MGIKELVEGFVFKIALKKGVKTLVGVVGSAAVLQQAGFNVDVTKLETWLMSAGAAGITMALNFLKVKTSLGKKLL